MGIRNQNSNVWVDGLIRGCSENDTAWFACDAEANYQNAGGANPSSTSATEAEILSHGYYKLSYASPNVSSSITKLGYDTAHPFLNFANEASGGSSTTYYCDQYRHSSGSRPVYCNVGYADASNGWFFCNASDYWNSNALARLCYRPILGATGYTE